IVGSTAAGSVGTPQLGLVSSVSKTFTPHPRSCPRRQALWSPVLQFAPRVQGHRGAADRDLRRRDPEDPQRLQNVVRRADGSTRFCTRPVNSTEPAGPDQTASPFL